jgi:hypothetical protein
MASLRKYAGSSFIRVDDVRDRPIQAKIVEFTEGNFGRPVLLLDTGRRFTVSKTNVDILIAAYGDDDADLIGKRIELFFGFTKYQGAEKESVLVKPISPSKPLALRSDDGDGEIPY